MADITAPPQIAAENQLRVDRLLQKLAAWGGLPGIVTVALGTALLVIAAATVVWGISQIPLKLDGFLDAAVITFTLLCVALSLLLLIAPICNYVRIGQTRRLEVIKGYYSSGTIARYFDQFWAGRDGFADLITQWRERDRLSPAARNQLNNELKSKFDDLLKADFGFAMYVIPLALLTTVAAVVMYFGFFGGISLAKARACAETSCSADPLRVPLLGIKLDLVSVAAIFGAYAWVTSDSITRNYQATFHPSNLLWYALRLIIAVPLGEAVSMLSVSGPPLADMTKATSVLPGWGAFLAFVVSMFSLDSISKYLSIAVNKLTVNAQTGSVAERDDLTVKLPGVDEEIARRLAAEGITTIAQLVSVDPVRLSIRSGLPFDFVLGIVDAAILWTYVGGKITQLREFGFKGASNVLLFAELSGAELCDLAIAYGNAETARAAAETAKAQAAAASDAAERALATDPEAVSLRQEGQVIAAWLAAPGIDADETAALLQRQQDSARLLREAQARLEQQQALAERTRQKAEADAAAAAAQAKSAMEALCNPSPRNLLMLQQIAAKTGILECGFDHIVAQLIRDPYADFICRLLGVSAKPAA